MIPCLVMPHRVMRASAGTGKTYQLVHTYVQLVMDHGLKPCEIIAITFTKKAAAELKTRIRAQLLARGAAPDLISELARAPLSNFHGLALQLLRQYGLSSGWATPMRVLGDEGDDQRMFLRACEHAWFANDNASVVHAVKTVAPLFALDRTLPYELWDAINLAREEGRSIGPELFMPCDVQALQHNVHGDLRGVYDRILTEGPDLGGKAAEIAAWMQDQPLPTPDMSSVGWARMWTNACARIDRRTKLKTIVSDEDLTLLKEGPCRVVAEAHAMRLQPAMGQLITAAWHAYEHAKQRHRAWDFVDLVAGAVRLLEEDVDVYHKLRSQVRAVLVDEAQDTNRLQRHFVRLLVGFEAERQNAALPALATMPPLHEAALCVVGDRKQAIYTFRGADPTSFAAFMHDVVARGGSDDILTTSRRSTPTLVQGINHLGQALFGDAYEALEAFVTDHDVPPAHVTHPFSSDPAMLWYSVADTDTSDASDAAEENSTATHPLSAAEATLREARAVAHSVAERIAAGASPADFAVLMAQKTTATLYARAMRDRHIPVVLSGGDGFFEQADVIDVLSLLRWITDPYDRLSAAIALRSPLFGVSDSGLLHLLHRVPDALSDQIPVDGLQALRTGTFVPAQYSLLHAPLLSQDAAIFARINQHLPQWIAAARVMSVAECLEHLETSLQWRAVYLTTDDGEQSFANQDRLLTLAERFDASGRGGIARFAYDMIERMWDGQREAVVPMPQGDRHAVSIMTVHQSKGLQFPVVILAGLMQKGRRDVGRVRFDRHEGMLLRPNPSPDARMDVAPWRWHASVIRAQDNEDAERRRLLYVAITRAERHLIFVGRSPCIKATAHVGFAQYVEPWLHNALDAGVIEARSLAWHTCAASSAESPSAEHPPSTSTINTPPAFAPALAPRSVHEQAQLSRAQAALHATQSLHAAPGTRFELPVTQLETYMQCARRGYWLHVLQQHEPQVYAPTPHPLITRIASGDVTQALGIDPLSRGRLAHAILAAIHRLSEMGNNLDLFIDDALIRAGHAPDDPSLRDMRDDVRWWLASDFGEQLRALRVDARRHEWPFQLVLPAPPFEAVLHGQIDLLYWDNDGPVIVDFKHAKAASGGVASRAYETQLSAYALAIAHRLQHPQPVRTVLVYLKERRPPQIHILTPDMLSEFQTRIVHTVQTLAAALWQQHDGLVSRPMPWPGRDHDVCMALGCGFVNRCHPGGVPV